MEHFKVLKGIFVCILTRVLRPVLVKLRRCRTCFSRKNYWTRDVVSLQEVHTKSFLVRTCFVIQLIKIVLSRASLSSHSKVKIIKMTCQKLTWTVEFTMNVRRYNKPCLWLLNISSKQALYSLLFIHYTAGIVYFVYQAHLDTFIIL